MEYTRSNVKTDNVWLSLKKKVEWKVYWWRNKLLEKKKIWNIPFDFLQTAVLMEMYVFFMYRPSFAELNVILLIKFDITDTCFMVWY